MSYTADNSRLGRRLGHEPLWPWPLHSRTWAVRWLLRPPLAAYMWCFYDGRPDGTIWWRRREWTSFHSQKRWWHALWCYLGPPSHLLWNVKVPLSCCGLVCVLVIMWQHLRATCCSGLPALDQSGYAAELFRLCSFALSLVLSFRLKAAYDRWWSARCGIGNLRNAVVTLVMQATSFIADQQLVGDIARWAVVWVFCIHQTVTLAPALEPQAAALLDEEELAHYSRHGKPRFAVHCKMRQLVADAGLRPEHYLAMDRQIQLAFEAAGSCARLGVTPMPYGLTLFSSGFIFIWMLLLPFNGADTQGEDQPWSAGIAFQRLVPNLFMAMLLLGADEIANQLEDPFALLPLQPFLKAVVDDVRRAQDDAATWARLRRRGKQDGVVPECTAVGPMDGGLEDPGGP